MAEQAGFEPTQDSAHFLAGVAKVVTRLREDADGLPACPNCRVPCDLVLRGCFHDWAGCSQCGERVGLT